MDKVVFYLKKIASKLEAKNQTKEASVISVLAENIAIREKEAQEMLAAEELFIKTAIDEYAEANREIEAAQKKKKKWVQSIGLKKGRLTAYKKPGESMEEAAKRALESPNSSVRGMGSFFFAARKFKHKKKSKD
jgi:hypothetical protein